MSEYQNKAVELMRVRLGEKAITDISCRRTLFLRNAIILYRALGGTVEGIDDATESAFSEATVKVDVAIGDVMYKLASIGYACDIDIIQAAYNKLDEAAVKLDAATKKLRGDKLR